MCKCDLTTLSHYNDRVCVASTTLRLISHHMTYKSLKLLSISRFNDLYVQRFIQSRLNGLLGRFDDLLIVITTYTKFIQRLIVSLLATYNSL